MPEHHPIAAVVLVVDQSLGVIRQADDEQTVGIDLATGVDEALRELRAAQVKVGVAALRDDDGPPRAPLVIPGLEAPTWAVRGAPRAWIAACVAALATPAAATVFVSADLALRTAAHGLGLRVAPHAIVAAWLARGPRSRVRAGRGAARGPGPSGVVPPVLRRASRRAYGRVGCHPGRRRRRARARRGRAAAARPRSRAHRADPAAARRARGASGSPGRPEDRLVRRPRRAARRLDRRYRGRRAARRPPTRRPPGRGAVAGDAAGAALVAGRRACPRGRGATAAGPIGVRRSDGVRGRGHRRPLLGSRAAGRGRRDRITACPTSPRRARGPGAPRGAHGPGLRAVYTYFLVSREGPRQRARGPAGDRRGAAADPIPGAPAGPAPGPG